MSDEAPITEKQIGLRRTYQASAADPASNDDQQERFLTEQLATINDVSASATEELVDLIQVLGRGAPQAVRNKHKIYSVLRVSHEIYNYIIDTGNPPRNQKDADMKHLLDRMKKYCAVLDALEECVWLWIRPGCHADARVSILLAFAEILPFEITVFGPELYSSWMQSRSMLSEILNKLCNPPFPVIFYKACDIAEDTFFDDCSWLSRLLYSGIDAEVDVQFANPSMSHSVLAVTNGLHYLEAQIKYGAQNAGSKSTRELVLDIATLLAQVLAATSSRGEALRSAVASRNWLITALAESFSIFDLDGTLEPSTTQELASKWKDIQTSFTSRGTGVLLSNRRSASISLTYYSLQSLQQPHSRSQYEDWEAFRDAEVLDCFLLLVSDLDLNSTIAMNPLGVVLNHFKNLFICPSVAIKISSYPRMKVALSNHMSHVVATVHRARQTAQNSEDVQLASIQISTLIVIGALLKTQVFKDDEGFLLSLDREKVLSILFETYITSEPTPDAIHLGYGTTILTSYFKNGVFDNTAIDEILEHHTTEDVARRCLELFESESLSLDSPPFGSMHFMLCANHSPKMHRPLVEAGALGLITEMYWRWVALKRRNEEDMCLYARAMTRVVTLLLRSLEGEEYTGLKNRVVSEMVRQTELILFLGRTLLGRSFESASGDVLYIGRCIADAISNDRHLMDSDIKAAWMHCFKCLDDFILVYPAPYKDNHEGGSPLYEPDKEPQPDFKPAIQGWKDFGELLGFDRAKILAEAKMGGLEGCSWFKCALYHDTKIAPLREMLKCSACKSVQYCGKRCQKLDWTDGEHKQKCRELKK
ncbi:hypothetical protein FRC04_007506 [Tulasnella sp. 424]|nr:hypothetical protein FRC04_007506 [Tulasnella sp. 424]